MVHTSSENTSALISWADYDVEDHRKHSAESWWAIFADSQSLLFSAVFFRRHFSPVAVYLLAFHLGFVASTRASAVIAAALPIFIMFDVISEFMCWTKLSMPYVCISIYKLINQSIGAHVINMHAWPGWDEHHVHVYGEWWHNPTYSCAWNEDASSYTFIYWPVEIVCWWW